MEAYRKMLRIASVEGPAADNAPYGPENRQALDYALELCEGFGFSTKDLEGHAGYGQFGSGEKLIMSLGHLDVVPVGPGWKHQPFGAEIDGGYVYARGAVDDKGPTMASLWAMAAIRAIGGDGFGVRFRQVFGCDEESGFGCMERYVQTEEAPTFGIAPDSGWPCYHAEKRITDLLVVAPIPDGSMTLLKAEGGSRPNIVIDSFEARVRVSGPARSEVEDKLADAWDRNVTYAWEGDELGIFAIGKAAHGSRPFDGVSAAVRAFRFLRDISPLDSFAFYDALMEIGHPGGEGLGISGSDDIVGPLTSNLGVVTTSERGVELLFNLRVPVKVEIDGLLERARKSLADRPGGWSFSVERDSPGLYFPVDHPLVATIVDVYAEESGERREPGTMGGGTYARAVPNTVSVGTGWEGDGGAHETDERLKVDHLYRMARIYGRILLRLAEKAA